VIKHPFLSAALLPICLFGTAAYGAIPQYLPAEAQWCLNQGCIELEIPKTVEQFQKGLMQRPALGPWRGMWFRFEQAQRVGFWMHKCIVPLDLVFIRDGKIVEIKANLPPCLNLPCPNYFPIEPVTDVIELQAGRAEELGLKLGMPAIPIQDLKVQGANHQLRQRPD
jgi:uncharacterized membrane protein (UPF0127 family)